MDRDVFAERLREATDQVLVFTRAFVLDELPDSVRYLIAPNSSFDENPLRFDEEVYPEDELPEDQEHLPPTDATNVVAFLWRKGKVPEWINIQVHHTDASYSYVLLLCCGRYTAGEGLYYLDQELPPFHVVSPPLPIKPSQYKTEPFLRVRKWIAGRTGLLRADKVVMHGNFRFRPSQLPGYGDNGLEQRCKKRQ